MSNNNSQPADHASNLQNAFESTNKSLMGTRKGFSLTFGNKRNTLKAGFIGRLEVVPKPDQVPSASYLSPKATHRSPHEILEEIYAAQEQEAMAATLKELAKKKAHLASQ